MLTSPTPPSTSPPPALLDINKWGILLLCFHQSFPTFFASFFVLSLGCTLTCGILVSQPEIKPTTPAVEERSFNHWKAREVPRVFHLCIFIPLLSTENYKWCVCGRERERDWEGRQVRNPHLKKKKKIHVELWFKCADYVSFSWLSLNTFESAKKKNSC